MTSRMIALLCDMASAIRQDFPNNEPTSWFARLDHKLELLERFDSINPIPEDDDDILLHLPNVGMGILPPTVEQRVVEEAAWEIAVLRGEIERMAVTIDSLQEG